MGELGEVGDRGLELPLGIRRTSEAPASDLSPADTDDLSTKPPCRSVTRITPSADVLDLVARRGQLQLGGALHLAPARATAKPRRSWRELRGRRALARRLRPHVGGARRSQRSVGRRLPGVPAVPPSNPVVSTAVATMKMAAAVPSASGVVRRRCGVCSSLRRAGSSLWIPARSARGNPSCARRSRASSNSGRGQRALGAHGQRQLAQLRVLRRNGSPASAASSAASARTVSGLGCSALYAVS